MSELRICEACKQEFLATGGTLTCSKPCSRKLRLTRVAERSRLAREREKQENGSERRACMFDRTPPKTPLHGFMERLNAYNAAHRDKPLSYGKYVEALEAGTLER